jgi:uncharacterized protein (UPF0548 family)
MNFPDRAVSIWFGHGRQFDAHLLSTLKEAPLTYSAEQELDHNWNVDHYEIILGYDTTGDLFRRAVRQTMNNQFYPPEVMVTTSDFGLENRPVRTGDRVLQRIRIFMLGKLPLLEVLTVNEITQVIQEERRAGFTYTTTSAHSEIGEWSPIVEWRENGEVVLVISVVSRSRPGASEYTKRFTRRMQLRAHKLSIESYLAKLKGNAPQRQKQAYPADLLPVGMIALAFLLLVSAVLGITLGSKPKEN